MRRRVGAALRADERADGEARAEQREEERALGVGERARGVVAGDAREGGEDRGLLSGMDA